MRSLSLCFLLLGGCAFRAAESPAQPKAEAPVFDPRPQAEPTGRAVGRSSWSTLAPGARVRAVTKKGTFVGGFILYHDGVLWLSVDGGNRKSFDALEVVRLYVTEAL